MANGHTAKAWSSKMLKEEQPQRKTTRSKGRGCREAGFWPLHFSSCLARGQQFCSSNNDPQDSIHRLGSCWTTLFNKLRRRLDPGMRSHHCAYSYTIAKCTGSKAKPFKFGKTGWRTVKKVGAKTKQKAQRPISKGPKARNRGLNAQTCTREGQKAQVQRPRSTGAEAKKYKLIFLRLPVNKGKKYLRGGTRKVGKQERNRRKNEGERGGKNT